MGALSRVIELGNPVALLGEPLTGLGPVCLVRGHRTGRGPVGYALQEEDMSTYTLRPVDEPVFADGDPGGCGKRWEVRGQAGDGSDTLHVCARPADHGATMHRCASGCWWSGPEREEPGISQGQYLIWSLGRKKWMAPEFAGYVERVDQAGRFGALEARGACTQHTLPMRQWRPTKIWPYALHNLPAIRVAEAAVLEVAHRGTTLQSVINSAARGQVPGWDEYWAEIGEAYVL